MVCIVHVLILNSIRAIYLFQLPKWVVFGLYKYRTPSSNLSFVDKTL